MGIDFRERSSVPFALAFPLGLIGIAPFLSLWRVGPLSSFYLETGSLLFLLLLVVLLPFAGRLNTGVSAAFEPVPRGSIYFLLLAAFWWIQARLMDLPYLGQSGQAVWTFLMIALGVWAVRAWVNRIGQEAVVDTLAAVLTLGAVLQAAVCWLQFSGVAAEFPGILAYRGANDITGQLGQRNHLGHYLMWGVLSAAYLWARRKLPCWAGAAAVLFLTATLGLVNSRTILLYVVACTGLLLFWRLRAGCEGNRAFAVLLLALLMVVAVQFYLNHIFAWFGGSPVETALQRVENSAFSGSAREIEWRNAWQVFQTAPLWGHGWGSFSLQGFLNSRFENGFSPHGISVLFTHSHNIVLQILAEMGAAGALLVFGGALWVVAPLFRRPFGLASLLPLALMSVSLCHSLLEYPLWYVYFLVPFALMMNLAPPSAARPSENIGFLRTANNAAWQRLPVLPWGAAALAVILSVGILRLGWVYHDLTAFDRRPKNEAVQKIAEKIDGLRRISQNEPLLAYYADLSLTRRIKPQEAALPDWAVQAADKALLYRPYATAYLRGMYLYRLGRKEEAAAWFGKLFHYYPNMLPFYSKQLKNPPFSAELYPAALAACREFKAVKPAAKACE
ncbi:MAG: Wzy polymerase domain-containing protein [Neisseria sp.]|nr:Wzy polymerase domain-containing protein [Neisseria sp.]